MEYKQFYSDIEEDYPPNWNLETFKALKSFSKRIAYCNENLKRLASGSSRIAYKVDEEKVLKIAKNAKGIAQNSVERDRYIQQGYSDIVAKVYEVDENDLWLEMELAKKLTPNRFKSLLGFSIDDLDRYLRNFDDQQHGRRESRMVDPTIKSVMDESEWVNDLKNLMMEADMPPGDLGRISTYGESIRNGKAAVIIIDLGLTNAVYSDFYARK
jgi:hypothetical protein